MPKPELEFFSPDHLSWRPLAGSATGGAGGPGVMEKILSQDPETGDVTRLLRFEAGVETTDTITHDFWEEVWIVDGTLIDFGKQQTFRAGMYACRPPGMVHGPVPRTGRRLHDVRDPLRQGSIERATVRAGGPVRIGPERPAPGRDSGRYPPTRHDPAPPVRCAHPSMDGGGAQRRVTWRTRSGAWITSTSR